MRTRSSGFTKREKGRSDVHLGRGQRWLARRSGLPGSAIALTALCIGATATRGYAQDTAIKKCNKPVGTLTIVDPDRVASTAFVRYKLGSPVALIRLMVQQSNCFLIVERGAAMQDMQRERALARGGQTQQDANMGGGQLKAADFILTPSAVFSEGKANSILGVQVTPSNNNSSPSFVDAQTSMLLTDSRTGIQVASAEGKAEKKPSKLAILFGTSDSPSSRSSGISGYTNTDAGRVVAASYVDNYNKITDAVKANPALMKRAETFQSGLSGDDVKAGVTFAEGDVLVPKIDNIKLLAEPKDDAKELATLRKTDELVFMGAEQDGFVKVQGSGPGGWVRKVLVVRKAHQSIPESR